MYHIPNYILYFLLSAFRYYLTLIRFCLIRQVPYLCQTIRYGLPMHKNYKCQFHYVRYHVYHLKKPLYYEVNEESEYSMHDYRNKESDSSQNRYSPKIMHIRYDHISHDCKDKFESQLSRNIKEQSHRTRMHRKKLSPYIPKA